MYLKSIHAPQRPLTNWDDTFLPMVDYDHLCCHFSTSLFLFTLILYLLNKDFLKSLLAVIVLFTI